MRFWSRSLSCWLLASLTATISLPLTALRIQAQISTSPKTVFVHLFEWKWTDIAKECENYLGPKGFAAVQISPPNEHAVINQKGNFPWWQRYQPVSYSLAKSRSGTLAEFKAMITRCRNVSVDIYADAVINHMTAGNNVGSNGTIVSKYNYPGLYRRSNFHADFSNNPEFCGRSIEGGEPFSDYSKNSNNAVRRCELVGLADLSTSSSSVRQKIAAYLISMARMGVRGFRIDAAKHINPGDIDNIISRVNAAVNPDPYVYLEVIDRGGEAITASNYFGVNGGNADINEFKYGQKVGIALFVKGV